MRIQPTNKSEDAGLPRIFKLLSQIEAKAKGELSEEVEKRKKGAKGAG